MSLGLRLVFCILPNTVGCVQGFSPRRFVGRTSDVAPLGIGKEMNESTGEGRLWRGIFVIPVTPFRPSGQVDQGSLARQIEFCIASGAHGIVYPGVVSEFFALGDDEREIATSVVIEAAAARVPVVVGVSAASTPVAASLAGHARKAGAAGVMAMLPYVDHFFAPDDAFVERHFAAIAEAGGLPMILQNARIGHSVGFPQLGRLVAANPLVRYLKQETSPCTHELSAALEAVGNQVDGVFSGLGSVYLINELDRGACGSMPAPPFVDILVDAYSRYVAGNRGAARDVLAPLGSLFNLELLYNVAVIKEILFRRGVIAHTTCRVPAPNLDSVDHGELDELLAVAGVGQWDPGAVAAVRAPALSQDVATAQAG